MGEKTKVAVLLSTYNGAKYIKEQIDSILNQNGDFQLFLFVRDDGSIDETTIVLDEYRCQGKLYWQQGENLKPAMSFLTMLWSVKGFDYYAFADQDDIWKPDKISQGIKNLKDINSPAIYLSNGDVVDSQLNSLGRMVYQKKPIVNPISILCAAGIQGCSMLLNDKLVTALQKRELPDAVIMHDSYVSRVCTAIGGIIIFDNTSLMLYRQHGDNVIGVQRGKMKIISSSLRLILQKNNVSIADLANDILVKYNSDMPERCIEIYEEVSKYKKNILTRAKLASSSGLKFINLRWSLINRIKILLGNQ